VINASGRNAHAWGAALSLALALGMSACGVRTDSEPSLIAEQEVAQAITPDTEPSSFDPTGPTERVVVYFLRGKDLSLAPVFRKIPQDPSGQRRLRAIAVQLAAGPNPLEQLQHFRTSLDQVEVNVGNLIGGQITVDIGREFPRNGTTQITAVAQIVATLTAVPGVGKVQFHVNGLPAGRLLDASGAVIEQPVSFDSYASLVTGQDSLPRTVEIVLVDSDGRLVTVRRKVEANPDQTEQLRLVLAALNNGPTEQEAVQGLRSTVTVLCKVVPEVGAARADRAAGSDPPSGCAEISRVGEGMAVIDLGDRYNALTDSQRVQALAALVGTVTGLPRLGVVTFLVNARDLSTVPNATGQARGLPVSRDDYASILPPPPPQDLP
jgi:spore germination protein GerM